MACVGAAMKKPSWPIGSAAIFAPVSGNTPSVLVAAPGSSLSIMGSNETPKFHRHEAEPDFHAYAAGCASIRRIAADKGCRSR